MGSETNKDDRNTTEYLAQLINDKKQMVAFPNIFVHVDKLLDEEINKVRLTLFHHENKKEICLPDPNGPVVTLQEKLFVPIKDHPDFNFVGRILGPRGMTAKELEKSTGCKIMVRGKGSMRDRGKEEVNRGKVNWEHLNEDLHVLITVEDSPNRAEVKIAKAVEEVKQLLVPAPDGEDELKKRQLMELSILNGTYRDQKSVSMLHPLQVHRFLAHPMHLPMRSAPISPAGAPIILTPRLPGALGAHFAAMSAGNINGCMPPLVSPPRDAASIVLSPYEAAYAPYTLSNAPTIFEYPRVDPASLTAAGVNPLTANTSKIRRALAGIRDHPYNRLTIS